MAKIRVTIDKQWDVAVYNFEGDVTFTDVRDAIIEYYNGPLTKYTFWDFSDTNVNKVSNAELKQLGDLVSKLGSARKGCFDTVVVPGLLKYGMARIYAGYAATLQKDKDALKTLVFKNKDDAFGWIRSNSISKGLG